TAKKEGNNAVRVAPPELRLGALRRLAATIDETVRRRAAASLAAAVDEREASPGRSLRVGELASRIAVRLGVESEEVGLVWLAGSLHDPGKLAIPEMTSPRPYRAALSPREALAELRRGAGTQFDPDVVAALAEEIGFSARRVSALAS